MLLLWLTNWTLTKTLGLNRPVVSRPALRGLLLLLFVIYQSFVLYSQIVICRGFNVSVQYRKTLSIVQSAGDVFEVWWDI